MKRIVLFCILAFPLVWNWNTVFSEDGNYVILLQKNNTADMPKIRSNLTREASLPAIIHLLLGTDILIYPMIYGASDSGSYIQRFSINTDFSEFLKLYGIQNPYGICVDNAAKKIYWTDYGVDKIFCSNFNGSDIKEIISSDLVYPCGIEVDEINNKLYWTDWGNSTIKRSNLDGTNIEILLNGSQISAPVGITLDVANGHFYFADEGTLKIQRANLNGSQLIDIATNLPSPHGIVYYPDQQKLFWTNWVENSGSVQKSDLDGSNIVDIVTGLNWAMGITIDTLDKRLYYSLEGDEGEIRTCKLDGTDDRLAFSNTKVPFIVFIQN